VWFFERAEEMTNFPVRPEAPRTRKCISGLETICEGCELRVVSCCREVRSPEFDSEGSDLFGCVWS
jgi:hypothetical protein